MIKRGNIVKFITVGGYNRIVVTVDSRMSEEELRIIISKHGGEDHSEYCWFNNQKSFNSAIEELTDAGAYIVTKY